MDKKTKIAGLLALGAGAYFFYKNSQDHSSQIEGLNVNLDGDKLINSLGQKMIQNPKLRGHAIEASKSLLGRFLAHTGES